MRYVHRFHVRAPLAAVAAFHQQASSMAAITPPPVVVRMQQAPADLSQGGEMAFTLWLGPLPVPWRAVIDEVTSNGFRDRMIAGPFAHWVHRHRFRALDGQTTEVLDEVEAELPQGLARRIVAWSMWLNLPLLFAYRSWKTRRMLEVRARQPTAGTGLIARMGDRR